MRARLAALISAATPPKAEAFLEAHARHDGAALVGLYADVGARALLREDVSAGCFYLTHAYVYALEAADPRARDLHALLVSHGREA